MLCALIMAGGKGTRFWPLSTDKKPKQFLSLLGEDTMIQMTVKRLLPIIKEENIFIVTGKEYKDIVEEQLPNLPKDNIILEPYGKNTAPCIALSAFYINGRKKDVTLLVLPSDHLIKDENEFRKVIKEGEEFIKENNDSIVTIGIKPDRPETGYGYIKAIDNDQLTIESRVCSVEKFVEKPSLDKAKKYLEEGNYLWNAGMFIWKTDTILGLTKKYLSNTYEVLKEIVYSIEDYEEKLEEDYKKVDSISIDYGIMEKHDKIYVINSDFGWDDVGSWDAVERYCSKDENGNICLGKIKEANCKNNILVGNSCKTIVTDIEDSYIIENEGTIYIGKKTEVNRLKEIRNN